MIIIFSLNLCLSLLIFIFFDKISKFINLYDVPNYRKSHKNRISLSGGTLVFLPIFSFFLLLYIFSSSNQFLFQNNQQFIIFSIVSFFFYFIGFIDDKINLSANKKIFIFLFLLISLISLDPTIQIKILYFSFLDSPILLQNFSFIFTALSIFLFVNALNMYDGANLQVGNYIFILIIYICYKTNSLFLINIIIPLLFFLFLNFRNKTFLGNSGVYYIGFILSWLIIKVYNLDIYVQADQVLLILFYPMMDLLRLFIYRISVNLNPLKGDRNHIHHILTSKYGTNKKVQLILLVLVLFPVILNETFNINTAILLSFNLLVYLFLVKEKLFPNNKH